MLHQVFADISPLFITISTPSLFLWDQIIQKVLVPIHGPRLGHILIPDGVAGLLLGILQTLASKARQKQFHGVGGDHGGLLLDNHRRVDVELHRTLGVAEGDGQLSQGRYLLALVRTGLDHHRGVSPAAVPAGLLLGFLVAGVGGTCRPDGGVGIAGLALFAGQSGGGGCRRGSIRCRQCKARR